MSSVQSVGASVTTSTRQTSEHTSQGNQAVTTAGEIFPDGIIDLVASADDRRPNLLFWDGSRATIAPRIPYAGIIYEAPVLHRTIGQAIRLPASVSPSG